MKNSTKSDVASELADVVLQATQVAVMTTSCPAEAICIATSAAISAATIVATLVGNGYGAGNDQDSGAELEIDNAVTKESLLYAACLLASTVRLSECESHPGENHAVGIDFGPHALLKAMEMYEKLKGEKPDKYLHPQMVQNTREYEARTPRDQRVNPHAAAAEAEHNRPWRLN